MGRAVDRVQVHRRVHRRQLSRANATCCSIAASVSSRTKSARQYHWGPAGRARRTGSAAPGTASARRRAAPACTARASARPARRRVLRAAGVAPDDAAHLAQVQLLGEQRRPAARSGPRTSRCSSRGADGEELAVGAQHLGASARSARTSGRPARRDRVQRNWNEVTTPKLPPPPRRAQNRSGFSSALARDERAVGQDDLGLEQVVDGQAVLAGEVADAAAEREAADAGGGDDPARASPARARGWPRRRRPRCSRRRRGRCAAAGSTSMPSMARQVEHDAVVADAEAAAVVAAAADGERQRRARGRSGSRRRRRRRRRSGRSAPGGGRSWRCRRRGRRRSPASSRADQRAGERCRERRAACVCDRRWCSRRLLRSGCDATASLR